MQMSVSMNLQPIKSRLKISLPFQLAAIVPTCYLARNIWRYYFPYVPGPDYCLTAFMMGQADTLARIIYFAALLLIAELSVGWAMRNWRFRILPALGIVFIGPYVCFVIINACFRCGGVLSGLWDWNDCWH